MERTTESSQLHSQYPKADVLLVTVTEVETRAVLAVAERTTSRRCEPLYIRHKTYYDLGTIGGARVFLVRSEMGPGGPGGSQATVQAGIDALSPSSVVMVGIAFGVNPEKQRIGDILISHQLQEYELQRVSTDPEGELSIIPRGERVGASTRLLDRFRDGALFWKEARTHFGLILSGQKIVDNVQFRNGLVRHWPEAIGGEMEGAGVYAAVQNWKRDWILIKAICDWADGRKGENKEQQQEEAARNAASFTIHVIQRGGLSENAPVQQADLTSSTETNRSSQQNHGTKSQQYQRSTDRRHIVIAYSQGDSNLALELGVRIESDFGADKVQVDFFDLDSDNELVTVISPSARLDNWFVLVASKHSAQSRWITYEARLTTFLEIEYARYYVFTVNLDNSPFPRELDLELRSRRHLEAGISAEQTIERTVSILREGKLKHLYPVEFFVNRGSELDELELAATRGRVIYVVGVPGIGKASLIRTAARTRFQRDILQVDIKIGHDLELLSREVISLADHPQPSEMLSDNELMQMAVRLLNDCTADRAMLFINHAENAMDTEGNLRPYLSAFLSQCIESGISFPIFLASSRRTEILPDDSPQTVTIKIDRLIDDFMTLIVKHWYSPRSQPLSEEDLAELIEQLYGYPLAARMIAGYLSFESPKRLAGPRFMSKFQLRIAEFVLARFAPILSPLDVNLLQALAIFGTGTTTAFLMGVKQIRERGLDEVQGSISRLSDLMLIGYNIDTIKLPPMVAAYFVDQSRKHETYDGFARDLANIAWKECEAVLRRINEIPEHQRMPANRQYVNLSTRLLRIAEPAHRLLLVTRQNEKAKQIPYRLRGHMREMVLVMYRQMRDYRACIDFATEWLKIEREDSEIRLYQARAYRQLHEYQKATRLLRELQHDQSPAIRSRVFRERGRIAYMQGNLPEAIGHYRDGLLKRRDGTLYYSLISIDLARALMAEADTEVYTDKEKQRRYAEAASRLEEAREFTPRFDEEHLDLYIAARFNADMMTAEEATELIAATLEIQGEDRALCFRAADILSRNQSRLQDAMHYARKAEELGDRRAPLTIAKIQLAQNQYDEARRTLLHVEPQSPVERVVLDVLRARTCHNDPNEARAILKQHSHLRNSFVACAQVETEINAAKQALGMRDYAEASRCLQYADHLVDDFSSQYDRRLFEGLREQISRLQDQLPKMP